MTMFIRTEMGELLNLAFVSRLKIEQQREQYVLVADIGARPDNRLLLWWHKELKEVSAYLLKLQAYLQVERRFSPSLSIPETPTAIAGGSDAPPTPDLVLEHTDNVNPIEVVAFEIWDQLLRKGDTGLAHDVLNNGLRAHHYWSFLPDDPAQITPEQNTRLLELLQVFRDLVGQANRQLSTGYSV